MHRRKRQGQDTRIVYFGQESMLDFFHAMRRMTGMKTLPEFIDEVGDEAAADLFGVKPRCAAGWRRGERRPRPMVALRIIAESRTHPAGPLTWDGIYRR